MYRIAIVDDDSTVCTVIRDYVKDITDDFNIETEMTVWYTGEDLYAYLKAGNRQDLIFLDIELVKKDGIWLGRMVREEMEDYKTAIVYISYEKNYALQLFESQPMDFLVKPILKEDIKRVMSAFLKKNKVRNLKFTFKRGHAYCNVFWEDILYFRSMGRKILIVEKEENQEFYGKLEEVKEQLPDHFLQIHKSYLVNEDYVREYMYDKIIMYNGEEISISRPYRRLVQERLLAGRGRI